MAGLWRCRGGGIGGRLGVAERAKTPEGAPVRLEGPGRMEQVFDPYHVWLGIPPQEQPPNHYRLLGIALYESSADVIATAADRQMGHLRTFQSGKHSVLSQRLLNEVAAAKVCLLSPVKKAAYDEQLREHLQPSPPEESAPSPVDSSPWAHPVAAQDTSADSSQWAAILDDSSSLSRRERAGVRAGTSSHSARKRRTSLGPMIAVAISGALLVAGFLVWNASQRSGNPPQQAALAHPGQKNKNEQPRGRQDFDQSEAGGGQLIGETDNPPVQTEPNAPPGPPEDLLAKPGPTTPSQPIAPDPSQKPPIPDPQPAAPVTRPIFEKPTEPVEKPAVPSFDFSNEKPANKPAEPKKRLPVPDEAAQQKIAAQIGNIYNPGRAKTPAEKSRLAYQLLQAAKASKNQDERYVLLRQGRELAGQAGEVALALQAIEMTADFDIDLLEEKTTTLLAFADKAQSAEQIRASFDGARRVIAQSLSDGRYKAASDLANAVCRACQRSQGKEFRKKAIDQRDWVRAYCQRQEQRQEAEAKLKADPDDAGAHLLLGCYYCLDDDWRNALPHLAKASDAELRQLAQREFSPPSEPNEQMKLADAWWALAQARQGEERDSWLLRAGYWYDRAHPKLSSGLERLKAEKRLEELVEVHQRRATSRRLLQPDKDSAKDLWNDLF